MHLEYCQSIHAQVHLQQRFFVLEHMQGVSSGDPFQQPPNRV